MARDLVLRVRRLPEPGGASAVLERHELLGGKGANQAVGLAQLGVPTRLVGVAGTDTAGELVVERARADGIDVAGLARRGQTALLVDIVDAPGSRRLLEHVPTESLLTPDDVEAAAATVTGASTVCVQLQQPLETALAAARQAKRAGARVVLDGVPRADRAEREPGAPERAPRGDGLVELLGLADVVRADAAESGQLSARLTGQRVGDEHDARRLAARLLETGVGLVALAVRDRGDLVVWPGGQRLHPLAGDPLDSTGAGDAFVAGMVAALEAGDLPGAAGEAGAAAAAATVRRLGGRPDLTGHRLTQAW